LELLLCLLQGARGSKGAPVWAALSQLLCSQGYLLSKFHKFYWMGLKATRNPAFFWNDPTVTPLTALTAYKHWGTPATAPREPNNLFSPENCGGANASTAYQNAWGWADFMCTSEFVYMCRWGPGTQSTLQQALLSSGCRLS
jgi:hypothetical protein